MNTEKKFVRAALAAIGVVLLFASCTGYLLGKADVPQSVPAGRLLVKIVDDTSRSIKPALVTSSVGSLRFVFYQGGSLVTEQTLEYGGQPSFELESPGPGSYTFVVEAIDYESFIIARSEQTVELAGGAQSLSVVLAPDRTEGGEGIFQLNLTVDNLPVPPESLQYSLVRNSDNIPVEVTPAVVSTGFPNQYNIFISQPLDSGDYLLKIYYEYAGRTYYLRVDPVVKIYNNLISGAIVDFSGVIPSSAASVFFDGSVNPAAYAGKRLFVSILNGAGTEFLCAGLGTIESNGSVLLEPYSFDPGSQYYLVPGQTYSVSAFIDMENVNSSITSVYYLNSFEGIIPQYDDPSFKGTVVAQPALESISLSPEQFEAFPDFVYFVSSGGGGSGRTILDPATVSSLQNSIDNNKSTDPTATHIIHVVGETLDLSDSLLLSDGSFVLRPALSSGAIIMPSGDFEESPLSISYGSLAIENIVLDGNNLTSLSQSALNAYGSEVSMLNSTIQHFDTTSYYGGGVYLNDSSLVMDNSHIIDCSAQEGGGVFIQGEMDANFHFGSGSTITGCEATSGNGGAVYLGYGAVMLLDTVLPLGEIKDNRSAGDGSGIFVTSDGILQDPGNLALTVICSNNISMYPTNMTPVPGVDLGVGGIHDTSLSRAFVSQTSLGNGDGLTPGNAMALSVALANPSVRDFVLVEDIELDTSVTTFQVTSEISITSLPNTRYALVPSSNLDGPFITLGTGAQENGGRLTLSNVFIGSDTGTSSGGPLFEVLRDSFLELLPGAVLRNHHNTAENGGAVYVDSGTFDMQGGEIYGCRSVGNGGAVYSYDGAIELRGGAIYNCVADGYGGAVAAYSTDNNLYSTVSMVGTTIGSATAGMGNSAQRGGGIYIHSSSQLFPYTGAVLGNSATDTEEGMGGGIFIATGAFFNVDYISSFVITQNSATVSGGGVYIVDYDLPYIDLYITETNCSGNIAPQYADLYWFYVG